MSHLAVHGVQLHEFDRSYVTVPLDQGAIAGTVFLVMFMFCAFIFNAIVIIAILRTPSLRTISNGLMLQLSIADCILSGVIGPVLLRNIINKAWLNGMDTPAEWQASASMGACFESIMSLTLIALHRYAAVVKQRTWTRNQTLLYCSPTWVAALALMTYSYYGIGEFDIESGGIMAGYSWYKRGLHLIPAIHSFVTLVICAIVISVCYYKIFTYVANANAQLNAAFGNKLTKEQKTKNKTQNNEVALAQRMIIIIGLFFACWTLYAILILYCLVSGVDQPVILDRFATILGHCNSMVNPVLFTYLDKRVTAAVYNLLTCRPANYVRTVDGVLHDAHSIISSQDDQTVLSGSDESRRTSTVKSWQRSSFNPARAPFNPRASTGSMKFTVNSYNNKRATTAMINSGMNSKFLLDFPTTTEETTAASDTVPVSTLDVTATELAPDTEAQIITDTTPNTPTNNNQLRVHINDQTPELARRRFHQQLQSSILPLKTPDYPNRALKANDHKVTDPDADLPTDVATTPTLVDVVEHRGIRPMNSGFSVVIIGDDDVTDVSRDV